MTKKLKRIVSLLLISIFTVVVFDVSWVKPVFATPTSTLNNVFSEAKKSLSNLEYSEKFKSIENSISDFDFSEKIKNEIKQVEDTVSNIDVSQKIDKIKASISSINLLEEVSQIKKSISHINLTQEVEQAKKAISRIDIGDEFQHVKEILSNQHLVEEAKQYLAITPDKFCTAYSEAASGVDNSSWQIIQKGAVSVFTLIQAMSAAATAGAGSLTGYAGMASAISQLGLGGLTTTIAGMLGSSATGAAATSVVTSFVGGPLIMGILLVGGTSAAGYGTYQASKLAITKLNDFAAQYCE
jgi:hypothetical protein